MAILGAAKNCNVLNAIAKARLPSKVTPVGFEPTQLALVELESTPLDHSGKVSWRQRLRLQILAVYFPGSTCGENIAAAAHAPHTRIKSISRQSPRNVELSHLGPELVP